MTEALADRVRRLEDLEAIRALDAAYCRALDSGSWDALVSMFLPDGEFVGLSTARGHAGLRSFFAALADSGLTAFWHHVTNLEIDLDGDRAHVCSFLFQPCVLHGVPHVAGGRYHDDLVRVGSVWRYQRKRVVFDYFTPLAEGWDHGRFSLDSARATRWEHA